QQADNETLTSAAADSAVRAPNLHSATAATIIGTSDDGSESKSDFGWCPDNYELLGEVARGGMGVVYRARQISADRVVALKVVKHGNPDSAEVERFLAEARAAARLHHPHIVPVYEVGEANGQPFFSMRLVDGLSLARRVADQPLDPRLAATLVRKVAEAIQFAHEHQIIHRDIKPGNILLNAADEPFVTDFGLARVMDQASDLTTEGQVMGTPSYMPPEQALGRRDFVNERSDVYSLGAVLYFCMTGRPPFQAASSMATVVQLLNQEVVAPRQLNADVPADLETICLKCLQKDAPQRYESAAAFADDLRRFLNNEPIAARPASTTEKFVKWVRRHPAWTALGVTGVIAMVATAIAFTSAAYTDELQTSLEQTQAAKRIVELREKETSQALDLAEEANERARKAEYFRQISLTSSAVDRGDFRAAMETFVRIDKSFDNWEFRYLHHVLFEPNRGGFRTASTKGTLTMQIASNGQRGAYLETGVESHFAIFDPRTSEITSRIPLGQHLRNFGSISEDISHGTIIRDVQNRPHVEIWNLESGSLKKSIPVDGVHSAVVSDSNGRWSVLLETRMNETNVSGMMIVDWENESLLDLTKYEALAPTAVSFRKDGSRAYASTIDGGRSPELTEFELPEWKVLQKRSLDYRVIDMALSNDAEELIMIGIDRRLHRFSIQE
ncbi:MAG: serine/threonine-protein kinase, partial [Rubripirellula sp.]